MKAITAKNFYPNGKTLLKIPELISELERVKKVKTLGISNNNNYDLIEINSKGIGFYKGLYSGSFKEVIAIDLINSKFIKRSVNGIKDLKKTLWD